MSFPRFCFAVLVALGLSTSAQAQVVQINSGITANTTWGPTGTVVGTTFWIRNSIAINAGTTLTIQPGVVIKLDPSRQITVNGTLTAIGTAVDTVVFTSIRDDNNRAGDTNADGNLTVPNASDWVSILFPDANPNTSQFTYCDVRYSGGGFTGAFDFQSSNATLTNCVIRRSYYGVSCTGDAAPTLNTTRIEASVQTPIVLDFTATPVFTSLVFSSSNNGYDAIGLRGGTLTGPTTLPKRGATVGANPVTNVTYVLLGSLTISASASLTIDPGIVLKPVGGQSITVDGALTMNGTAALGDSITITSIHDDNFGLPSDTNNNGSITAPNRGDWSQIRFNTTATGSISRCRLRFGSNSSSSGMIEMTNRSIPVSSSTLSEASHGLKLNGLSNPVITNVEIRNCSSTPVLMSVSANPTFTNIGLTANAITALGLIGEAIAVDSRIAIRNLGGYTNITYYLMLGAIQMQSPAVLRIDPGIVIKNQLNGGGMIIDGALIADAKPESLIVYTSERDDLYGNPPDTNGDGSTTTPAAGNCSYIRFTGTSDDALCRMDYVRVTYGSYGPFDGWNTSIWITNASPVITNCTIDVGTYGFRIDGNSAPSISTCTISNCSAAPFVMSVQSDPNIATNNTYVQNVYNAIALMSETLSQDATIKYRPGVGVPTFAYLPTGTITIGTGVTLSVRPQVVLKPTSSFVLFNVNGALNMVGSNATTNRVIITSRRDDNPLYGGDTTPNESSTPVAGDWGNIVFNDTAVDAACILRNVLFQFGSTGQTSGVLTTNSAGPRFSRLEFFQIATAFTFAGNSTPVVDSVNILNCTQLPIVSSLISNPQFPAPARVVLANNAYTAFGILGETIAQDVTTPVRALAGFDNLNYALAGNITIAFGAKWTIRPGVTIKLGRIFNEPFGNTIAIDGALVADGKPDSLIVFTSSADDAFGQDLLGDGAASQPLVGQWVGITFNAISDDAVSVIDHVRLRHAGFSSNAGMTFVNAGPTITNTFFTRNSYAAVEIAGNSTPTFTNCFFDSSTVPVKMSLVSEPVFNNVQFLGNTYTALGVIGESIAQDVLWKIRPVAGRNNMPYYLDATVTVGLGATLVMQPGVVVKMNSGNLVIQRAMQSEGRSRPDSMVVFTSYRDDLYGGDTNNDGSLTSPTASHWGSIQIQGTAIDPQVRFKNTLFRYGGSGSTIGAVRAISSSPSLDSCLFMYNSAGLTVEGASNPTARGCSFIGNTDFAINNTGGSFCVNAEGSWWGAASGPNDASATADLCGLGLNAGAGDKVSNNVDYLPFATSGIVNPLLGDVSLNGQVLAYDASLTLQYVATLIPLSPLQLMVADVSGAGGVSAFDASLILQYVAGLIPSFPANTNKAGQAPPDAASMAHLRRIAEAPFELSLGEPRRATDGWEVVVRISGDAPIHGVELRLGGESAARFTGLEVRGGAQQATRIVEDDVRIAVASLDAMPTGEAMLLRFQDAAAAFSPPVLRWARVNETEIANTPAPNVPSAAWLAAPRPNPTRESARIDLALPTSTPNTEIRVLDLAGRAIRTLHSGALAAGQHSMVWDLADEGGHHVPPGLYLVRARIGERIFDRRVIVVR